MDLLAWYDSHQRALPWRGERDPYRIWVSEVMLQQTQVTTVVPYYQQFLVRFPTLERLAQASLDEVLQLWQGLGYYARARHMHAAAREVLACHGGRLPANYDELRRLPGFGDYTAGAVASIAFGQPVPAVDGNARRVLARLFAFPDDVSRSNGARQLAQLAAELVPAQRPGDFNQALMELGATVCTPQSPACPLCPWQTDCQARAQGLQASLPVKGPRRPQPLVHTAAGVIFRPDGRVLICKRRAEGLLGGLWQFPGGRCHEGEAEAGCLRRQIKELLGIEVEVGQLMTVLAHAYTHFRIRLHVFACCSPGGQAGKQAYDDCRWVSPADLANYALPVTDQKIVALLAASRPPEQPDTSSRHLGRPNAGRKQKSATALRRAVADFCWLTTS